MDDYKRFGPVTVEVKSVFTKSIKKSAIVLAKQNCYKSKAVKHACVSAHRGSFGNTRDFLGDAIVNCSQLVCLTSILRILL